MPFTMILGGNMNLGSFLVGLGSGWITAAMVMGMTYDPVHGMVNKAMADCEASLPRNEHCYIIAVPPSKD